MLISTWRISAAPTKLFLSRSKALNASRISSSVNLPAGSLGASPASCTGPPSFVEAPGGAFLSFSPSFLAGSGLSKLEEIVTRPTGLPALSLRSRSPSNLPFAIHSIIDTLQRPMNLSFPTVSLSKTSNSISFSLLISKKNSSFQIGFFPPPGLGFVLNSCVPILSLAYGSALPNMPWPALSSTPRKHLTHKRPNFGGAGAPGGATACMGAP